jgi:excisionase family DNA binding protein
VEFGGSGVQDQYYTVEQIAGLLQMHPKTVQRYIREGKLRAVKVGKGWRVGGHDLSVFTESVPPAGARAPSAVVSCVADVYAADRDAAIRIMNTLGAAHTGKPPEYGRGSIQTQYIPEEEKLRVTLYGGARFTAAMLDAIAMLTDEAEE